MEKTPDFITKNVKSGVLFFNNHSQAICDKSDTIRIQIHTLHSGFLSPVAGMIFIFFSSQIAQIRKMNYLRSV